MREPINAPQCSRLCWTLAVSVMGDTHERAVEAYWSPRASFCQALPRRVGPGTAMVELQILLPVGHRFDGAAQLVQRLGHMQMGVGIVGVQVERDAERFDG